MSPSVWNPASLESDRHVTPPAHVRSGICLDKLAHSSLMIFFFPISILFFHAGCLFNIFSARSIADEQLHPSRIVAPGPTNQKRARPAAASAHRWLAVLYTGGGARAPHTSATGRRAGPNSSNGSNRLGYRWDRVSLYTQPAKFLFILFLLAKSIYSFLSGMVPYLYYYFPFFCCCVAYPHLLPLTLRLDSLFLIDFPCPPR